MSELVYGVNDETMEIFSASSVAGLPPLTLHIFNDQDDAKEFVSWLETRVSKAKYTEAVRLLRAFVDQGEPLRGDVELWSEWQVRVKAWKEASAFLSTEAPPKEAENASSTTSTTNT